MKANAIMLAIGLSLFGVAHAPAETKDPIGGLTHNIPTSLATLAKDLKGLDEAIKAKNGKNIHLHATKIKKESGRVAAQFNKSKNPNVTRLTREVASCSDAAHEAAHDDDYKKAQEQMDKAIAAFETLKMELK